MSTWGSRRGGAVQALYPSTITADTSDQPLGGPSSVGAWGTAHTKSAWYQISAGVACDCDGLYVTLVGLTTEEPATALLDIGAGPAGSERIIAPDLLVLSSSTYRQGVISFEIPMPLARGTRIAVRWQGSVDWPSAGGFNPSLRYGMVPLRVGSVAGRRACSRVATLGANTGTSTGQSIPTAGGGSGYGVGAWQEFTASAPFHVHYLASAISMGSVANRIYEIGVGAAGSERVLAGWHTTQISNGLALPVEIPAGSRIAMRGISNFALNATLTLWGN